MKFKKAFLIFAAVVFSCAFLFACGDKAQGVEYTYTESVKRINNPDQGFYHPIYVRVTEDGVSYNKNIVNDSTQLYHLRVDISAFSKAVNGSEDKLFTQAALDGLKELLQFVKQKDKNVVVRLAYDPSFGGSRDKEPELSVILVHVKQACGVFNYYDDTITAIEVGLIGPWGEMHSSAIAQPDYITTITRAYLDNTSNIHVLVRTPKMIYDFIGVNADWANYTVGTSDKAYRLGLFNDGYLGSDSDLGTYSDRARDVAFIGRQSEHLPFGGEVVIPDSHLHDINKCLPEMFQVNLSYLNAEWNNLVIDKWKNSTYNASCGKDKAYYGKSAFTYIENHLGYRFVMTKSTVAYNKASGELKVDIRLKNVGFGNLNRRKSAQLVIVDESGEVVEKKEVGTFTGESVESYSTVLSSKPENCDVYLRVYDHEYDYCSYCVQFANVGVWNAELKANKIGAIK